MSEELNPVTREEMFLAKAAGQNTPDLKPITRVERFLQNLIDHVKSIGSGGGSGGGAFYVTITGADGVYTADKTVAEITEAYEASRPVYCKLTASEGDRRCENFILPFATILEGSLLFQCNVLQESWTAVLFDGEASVFATMFARQEEFPDTLPSPGKLIFNGAVSGSYNGSGDVTITIPTVPTVADILAALPTWNGGSY